MTLSHVSHGEFVLRPSVEGPNVIDENVDTMKEIHGTREQGVYLRLVGDVCRQGNHHRAQSRYFPGCLVQTFNPSGGNHGLGAFVCFRQACMTESERP